MNETEAKEFAAKAIFETTLEHAKLSCVDGRYTDSQAEAISLAGGAAGLLEAALASARDIAKQYNAEIPDERVREIVLSAIGGKSNFKYHSDSEHGLDGCGHNKRCITRSEDYDLTPNQSEFIKSTLAGMQAEGIPPVELTGEHGEKAVFVVKLKNFNANDPETKVFSMHHQVEGQQAFIYTATLVEYMLNKLANGIHAELTGSDVTKEQILDLLKKEEAHQRGITVKELALDKGLPVYEVEIDDGKISEFKKIA